MRLGEKCPPVRECCVCHARASFNFKRPPAGEPTVLSISLSVYLRKNRQRIFKACPRVAICLDCLRAVSKWRHDSVKQGADAKQWAASSSLFVGALMDSILSIDALEQYVERAEGAKIA